MRAAIQREWYVTVAIGGDRTRTCDHIIPARNEYAARWLLHQLQHGAEIIHIRPTTPERHD